MTALELIIQKHIEERRHFIVNFNVSGLWLAQKHLDKLRRHITDDDFAALEGDDSGINEGDTIVEVFSSCLRKLSPGRHVLTFVYEGEEVSCYFTVLEKNLVTAATADAGSFLFGLVIFLGIALVLTLFIIYKVVMRKVFHPKH